MQDVLYIMNPTKHSKRNAVKGIHSEAYWKWIDAITDYGTKYPENLDFSRFTDKYFEFMKYFGEDYTAYNSAIDRTLYPQASTKLFKDLKI